MKLALACDWFLPRLGGIELHLRDLALRLRERGHDVHVITPTPGDPVAGGIPVHRVPARLFPGFRFAVNPGAFAALRQALRAGQFDLVHAHASIVSPAAYSAALSALADGAPTVVSFHSVLRNHAWWLRPVVRSLALPARGASFTAVSGVVAREAADVLGISDVSILTNAVDTEEWRPARRQRAGDEVLVVSAMRLEPKKRPRALLRMLAALRDAMPGLRFRARILGEGSERPALERLVRGLGLSGIVELPGRANREELRALYAGADLFVLPTRLEAFGIAVLEARAAGLPVVAMREAGVAALLEDGVDGLLASSDEEMIAALRRLITDPSLRARIAEHNAAVAPRGSWGDVLDEHERLYGRLLRG
ncbi:MAG TPA: glycosyltransferase family 4 protein [Gemmatimonadaceae bacterium]|nr:glycosyltransferase family 4 protein [Gemmatimonadaceae bacterium]